MNFNELLANINVHYNAFLLGMIYGWPMIDMENKILFAYSTYKLGTQSRQYFTDFDMQDFYNQHKKKLIEFFCIDEDIVINNNIIKQKFNLINNTHVGPGVSIKIDFDFWPLEISPEVFVLGQIEKALVDASFSARNKFILGVMDARGSLDFNHSYIAVDIARQKSPDIVKRKINRYYDLMGTIFNYNPRILQSGSNKKNDQFRLDLKYFMGKFGLFTPFKIEYYKKKTVNFKERIVDNGFFVDDNYKDLKMSKETLKLKNLEINDFAIRLIGQDLSVEEKEKIVEQYRQENITYDTADEILYSSLNVKNQAKMDADYKCELDKSHYTFIAKSDHKQYVEAHHLIPFSKRKIFASNIDIAENIVCLCPNCHRKIHLATETDRKNMLESLFAEKEQKLRNSGVDIDLPSLLSYYN